MIWILVLTMAVATFLVQRKASSVIRSGGTPWRLISWAFVAQATFVGLIVSVFFAARCGT